MQIDFIGHGLKKNNKLNVGDQIATSLISPNFDVFIGFVAANTPTEKLPINTKQVWQ